MDDTETFKRWLRIKFLVATASPDITGLNAYIAALGDGEAAESVLINSMSFEGHQSSGQVLLPPMVKLAAAMDVLAEIDPDNTPADRPNETYARFNRGVSCS